MFKSHKCERCKSKVKESFDFCPYCGMDFRNPEKDAQDFGMLGKNNFNTGAPISGGLGGLGITDRMLNSLMKSMFNELNKQMKSLDSDVQSFPNGVKIKFGVPAEKKKKDSLPKRNITSAQIEKMSGLPRVEAKTNVRRLSDKVVYELDASGVESVEDVFVSKLETGYEVKAIGKKKVYVNSLPINLPLKGYSINDNGLTVEFGLD